MSDSRIPGFYRLSVAERIGELRRRGWLTPADAELLRRGQHVLPPAMADRMIENVVGVFGLPFAIAPNFIVNGREYIVPMVVEEASIVAATSSAAKLARAGGGFSSSCDESLTIGQVHVADVDDAAAACARLAENKDALLAAANAVHPRLVDRGGGARDIEVRSLAMPDGGTVVALHFLVATSDAMGANLVNSICEAVAPAVAGLCGGDAALRILSNLADRSLVKASVRYKLRELASAGLDAQVVRDRIVRISDIARVDAHRAATHNKGIMNGIDAVAIATGNDWRAIEAGAHAHAAAQGNYGPLATWRADDSGDLIGDIEIPLKVGIVGGNLDANAAAAAGVRISGVESAQELGELMAAVGLAQNFAALKALATAGIQEGHMRLHARSVAASAGVPDELFDAVVDELVASGDVKVWKATEILATKAPPASTARPAGVAAGKVILLGEHAVVYGKHALALPIADAVTAEIVTAAGPPTISIPDWGVREQAIPGDTSGIGAAAELIRTLLGIQESTYSIRLRSALPRAMGLGSSAAIAVAVARALSTHFGLGLDDAAVNDVAFESEKLAHGTPSGIDNAVATYGEPMLVRKDKTLEVQRLTMPEAPPVVIAFGSEIGLTRQQVAGVRDRYDQSPSHYDAIFAEIDALSLGGAQALEDADYAELGRLMNICHGLLNAIGVSTAELELMVSLARSAGACGAKLTGAGGGGSVVALAPGSVAEVGGALESAGFRTMRLT